MYEKKDSPTFDLIGVLSKVGKEKEYKGSKTIIVQLLGTSNTEPWLVELRKYDVEKLEKLRNDVVKIEKCYKKTFKFLSPVEGYVSYSMPMEYSIPQTAPKETTKNTSEPTSPKALEGLSREEVDEVRQVRIVRQNVLKHAVEIFKISNKSTEDLMESKAIERVMSIASKLEAWVLFDDKHDEMDEVPF